MEADFCNMLKLRVAADETAKILFHVRIIIRQGNRLLCAVLICNRTFGHVLAPLFLFVHIFVPDKLLESDIRSRVDRLELR